MEATTESLSGLSIEDKRLNEIVADVKSSEELVNRKGDLDYLSKCSLKKECNEILKELLKHHCLRFLELLRVLGDNQGGVVVNVLHLTEDNRNDLLEDTCKIIGRKLMNLSSDNLQESKFLCSLYFNLERVFDVADTKRLDIFFGHVNCCTSAGNDTTREELNAIIALVILTYYKKNPNDVSERVQDYFDFQFDEESRLSYLEFGNMIKLLDILFPIMPEIMIPVYTGKKCTDHILNYVKEFATPGSKNEAAKNMARGILNLLSTSCLSEVCRKFNTETYLKFLEAGSKHSDLGIKLLSVLDIIKLWNFVQINSGKDINKIDINDLCDNLIEVIHSEEGNTNIRENVIEGLAYLSLQPRVAKRIRDDETVVCFLVSLISDEALGESTSKSYGLIVVFQNLTKIPEAADSRNRTIGHLKEVADPSIDSKNNVSNKDEILMFCRDLLIKHKIVQKFMSSKTHTRMHHKNDTTPSGGLLKIIYSIASIQEKKIRAELVKQGSMNTIMDFLITRSTIKEGYTRSSSEVSEVIEARLLGVRSLAKILISINPALIFNKYDQKSVASFIFELLGPSISHYPGKLQQNDLGFSNSLTNLDKFESLLALTNITSYNSNDLKDFVITKLFDSHLDNLIMESDFPDIQRTSWELVSNLITRPFILAKFFNVEENNNRKRLGLTIKLMNATDESLQIVIAGLLATATSEYDLVSYILIETAPFNTELIEILSEVLRAQTSCADLILRVSYLVTNLVFAAANKSESSLKFYKSRPNLKSSINDAIRKIDSGEAKEILRETANLLNDS